MVVEARLSLCVFLVYFWCEFKFYINIYIYIYFYLYKYVYIYEYIYYIHIWFESIRFSSTDANIRIASHGATAANLWSLAAL